MPNKDKPLPKDAPKPKDPPPRSDKPEILNSSSLYTIVLDKALVKHAKPKLHVDDHGDLVITIKTDAARHTKDKREPPSGTPGPREVKLKIELD